MSIWAIVWAYEQDVTAIGPKFALVTAAQYASDEGVCWVKQETLAADMGCTRRSVIRYLDDLEDKYKLIERVERRRKDGTRTSDLIRLVGFRKVTKCHSEGDQRDNLSHDQRDNLSQQETSVNETSLSNDSSNDESAPTESAPVKAESPGQYYNRELADRIAKYRKQGRTIHSPTDSERKDFGAMFKAADKDGYPLEILDAAIEYQVRKAAGLIENEPSAWCGFRTALDRVVLEESDGGQGSELERERSRDRRFEGYEWLRDRDGGSEPKHMTDREAKRALEEMREALGGPDDE